MVTGMLWRLPLEYAKHQKAGVGWNAVYQFYADQATCGTPPLMSNKLKMKKRCGLSMVAF